MIKNDNGFICRHCGTEITPLKYTSRDHCSKCLYSIHIDKVPGDRANTCLGDLVPIAIEPSSKKGYLIVYRCDKCGEIKRNKSAEDDDFEVMLEVQRNKANYGK